MGSVDKFLHKLENFDKENIPPKIIKALQPYLHVTNELFLLSNANFHYLLLQDAEFDPEKILSKSTAASGLCAWVINIHKFYNIYLVVEPKKKALIIAQNELKSAQEKLNYLNGQILVKKN